jgi:hypothetical protein
LLTIRLCPHNRILLAMLAYMTADRGRSHGHSCDCACHIT